MSPEFEEQLKTSNLINRQDFIRQGWQFILGKVTGHVEEALAPLTRRKFLRPPGAQMESLFLGLCTRCDACTAACPHEVISVHYGTGFPHDGTPVLINLRNNPCLLCLDTPCITACPTKALLPVESIESIRIGTAVIDQVECSAYRGSGCQICYDVCPLQDKAIQIIEGLPIVQDKACTGCGICQQHCPEEPAAIQVFTNFTNL